MRILLLAVLLLVTSFSARPTAAERPHVTEDIVLCAVAAAPWERWLETRVRITTRQTITGWQVRFRAQEGDSRQFEVHVKSAREGVFQVGRMVGHPTQWPDAPLRQRLLLAIQSLLKEAQPCSPHTDLIVQCLASDETHEAALLVTLEERREPRSHCGSRVSAVSVDQEGKLRRLSGSQDAPLWLVRRLAPLPR